uniref:ANK_REP_REGION domain-containing protein n=1 Tax=Panagrellus redivivus TaxID=6233 RepID=A0A7E4WBN9_PANRE
MSASKGPDWYDENDIDKMHMLAACAEGDIDTVRDFIERGVHVEECDDDMVTALQIAAARGHTKLTEYLLTLDPDLECCNCVGFTPLLHACREGHLEVVKLLIQRGAKLDVNTFTGASPLTLACAGGHLELVKYLITFKDTVDINPKTRDVSPSPLMAAAFKNQPVISSCLVSRGARVDYVMPQYSLDIMSCVVMCSSATMFSTLLDMGAKPEAIRNYKNSNIEDLVNICGRVDIWRVLQDYKRKRQRPYPKMVDIRQIIEEGRVVELSEMLTRPEKFIKLNDNETPLMFAVIFGRMEALRAILSEKPPLNAKETKLGLTALMIAAILGDDNMIVALLHAGAQAGIQCDFGWTAVDFAYSGGSVNPKVIAMLHRQMAGLPLVTKKDPDLGLMAMSTINRPGKHTIRRFLQRVGLEIERPPDSTPRDDFLSEFAVGNLDCALLQERFIMANDILHGDKRRQKFKESCTDDYMNMIRNVAQTWFHNGSLLKPFSLGIPVRGDYGRVIAGMEWRTTEPDDRNGNYSTAQRNCAAMLGLGSSKASTNSLTSSYSTDSGFRKVTPQHGPLLRTPMRLAPPALSASSGSPHVGGLLHLQPPPSPSTHSMVEHGEKHSPRGGVPKLSELMPYSHLRSKSTPSREGSVSSGLSGSHQYLRESSSSVRLPPKQVLAKVSDAEDIIQHKLRSIGLGYLGDSFREQEVDLQTFLRCDEGDIRQIVSGMGASETDIASIVALIDELRNVYSF